MIGQDWGRRLLWGEGRGLDGRCVSGAEGRERSAINGGGHKQHKNAKGGDGNGRPGRWEGEIIPLLLWSSDCTTMVGKGKKGGEGKRGQKGGEGKAGTGDGAEGVVG